MSAIIPLRRGACYHIYNRGNNRENLFVEARNYTYFLDLYVRHIEPIAETYAYCLMKNHFHLLVRIKDSDGVPEPSRCFSNLFNAYARAFNRAYARTGALFQRPFSRIEVTDDRYFTALVAYIHHNPQKHGFMADFRDWPYSSYHALASARPTRLRRDTILAWFGDAESFIAMHQRDRHNGAAHDAISDDDDFDE